MYPNLRSKHVEKIWRAMQNAGVSSITLNLHGGQPIRLTRALLLEFLCVVRGNKVDMMIGGWLNGLKYLRADKVAGDEEALVLVDLESEAPAEAPLAEAAAPNQEMPSC